MKKVVSLFLCLAFLLTMTTSASALKTVRVKSIRLSVGSMTLNVGKSATLKVYFTPANTTQKLLKYSTSNKNVVTVDPKGKLTAKKAGKAVITVSSSSNSKIMAKCNVTVVAPAAVKPVKITMFFATAGIKFPDDVDSGNNYFINLFEKAANVDVQTIMPQYSEYQTKFNLMMASGDIPDLVEYYNKDDINKYGAQGAFKDWKNLLPKAPVLKSYYSDEALKLMEAPNGGIYGLFALPNDSMYGTGVRLDLVNEVNGGVMPKTPDDWYHFFKNIKAKYPDAVPISPNNNKNLSRGSSLFNAYGVQATGIQGLAFGLQGRTVADTDCFWALEHKNIKTAIEFYKKLYDEGLLYKEFPTVTNETFGNMVSTKKIAFYSDTDEGNLTTIQQNLQTGGDPKAADKSAIWVYAPVPLASGVDIKEAVFGRFNPKGAFCLSINSKCNDETTAGIIRFAEALLDKKVLDKCVWGRDGIEYNTINGGRVINQENNVKTNYRLAYQFFRTFVYPEAMEFKRAAARSILTVDQRKVYDKSYMDGVKALHDAYNLNPKVAPQDQINLPDMYPKYKEASDKSVEIIYKAILGQISMSDFDSQVQDFVAKYKDVKDAYNNELKKYAK